MVALQIRHVPDELRSALSAEAERRGESLQTYLLDVLFREAASSSNRFLARRWLSQPLSAPLTVDVTELIARQRTERGHHLADSAVTHP